MIRAIIKPTMHELLRELSRKGLKLGDIDGVSRNESGHYFTVLQGDEVDDDIIDTTAGKIGVSKVTLTQDDTRTACGTAHTEVSSTIASTSPTATIALHALTTYIIPGTITIEDTEGVAPNLIDDGLGNLVEPSSGINRGSVNYGDGAVTFNYHVHSYPKTSVDVVFKHSAEPCVTNVPNQVKLKGIYVTHTGTAGSATISIYDSSSGGVPVYSASVSEGYYDLGGRISIQQDLTLSDRKYRWVSSSSVSSLNTVYLYWERVQ